jgi:hypothetical protein
MTDLKLDYVIQEIMKDLRKTFPEVTWDRYTATDVTDDDDDWQIDDDSWFLDIFGWVPNRKHGRDFVLIIKWASDTGEEKNIFFNTSSAKYSKEFTTRLKFIDHHMCKKVPAP